MHHDNVIENICRSIAVDDLNGLEVHEENGRLKLTDEDGGAWTLLVARVLPDPDHTAEECPQRLERPETTIPAAFYHGCQTE